MADSQNTRQHVRLFLRIRLMNHSLIPLTCGSGLIGIDARNQNQFVFYLFLHPTQAVDIIADSIFIISGTGPDDDQKFITFSCEHLTDHLISLRLDFRNSICNGIFRPDSLRCRQLFFKCKTHIFLFPPVFFLFLPV